MAQLFYYIYRVVQKRIEAQNIVYLIYIYIYLMPICMFSILYAYLYVFNIHLICRYGVSIMGQIRIKQPYIFITKGIHYHLSS
jgi:hypothetical protein